MSKIIVTVNVILHATEDITKVLNSLAVLGTTKDDYAVTTTSGHYDNPITILTAKFSGLDADNIITQITSKISKSQIDQLISEIPSRTVNSQFHLRLDKQDLLAGRISLGDSIKIKIHCPIYNKADTVTTFTDMLKLK